MRSNLVLIKTGFLIITVSIVSQTDCYFWNNWTVSFIESHKYPCSPLSDECSHEIWDWSVATRDAFKTPVRTICKQAKKFNHIVLKSTAQLNLCPNDFYLIAYVLVVARYFQDGFSRTLRHPSFTFSLPCPFHLSSSHFASLSLHEHLYNLTPSKNDKYLCLFSGVCTCVWFLAWDRQAKKDCRGVLWKCWVVIMQHLSAVMLLTPSLKTVCNICTEQVRVAVLKQSLNVCSPSAVSCIFFFFWH